MLIKYSPRLEPDLTIANATGRLVVNDAAIVAKANTPREQYLIEDGAKVQYHGEGEKDSR